MAGTLVADSPLVTTLHYYNPHTPTTLVQISQTEPMHCRSRATSPVSCLTPPPEVATVHPTIESGLSEIRTIGVQDASNQTDSQDMPDDDSHIKQENVSFVYLFYYLNIFANCCVFFFFLTGDENANEIPWL